MEFLFHFQCADLNALAAETPCLNRGLLPQGLYEDTDIGLISKSNPSHCIIYFL